jgi:hypothetical protein
VLCIGTRFSNTLVRGGLGTQFSNLYIRKSMPRDVHDVCHVIGCVPRHWMCATSLDVCHVIGCVPRHWMCATSLDAGSMSVSRVFLHADVCDSGTGCTATLNPNLNPMLTII